MSKKCQIQLLTFLMLMCFKNPAFAHALAPSLLELRQIKLDTQVSNQSNNMQEKTQYAVFWKQPIKQAKGVLLTPQIRSCEPLSSPVTTLGEQAYEQRWQINCPADPSEIEISIAGLESSSTYVLFRLHGFSDQQIFALLDASSSSYQIPRSTNQWQRFKDYTLKGLNHFFAGYDHMLFVFGLIVLLRDRIRKLIFCLTFFTLGHGISLGFAANGFIPLNGLLVEVFILATLIWMALEILSSNRALVISFKQHPYLLASSFGMIHGLGFAGAFLEYSHTHQSLLMQLLAFNLGIELAQIALIMLVLPLILCRRKINASMLLRERFNACLGYLMGGASCYWLLSLAL